MNYRHTLSHIRLMIIGLLAIFVLAGCLDPANLPQDSTDGISAENAEIPIGDAPTVTPSLEVKSSENANAQQSDTLAQPEIVDENVVDAELLATVEMTATVTPTPTSSFNQTPCEFETAFLERGIKCGYVTVPEDHNDPHNGRKIDLHVAVLKSDSSNRVADPILYLAGGPGEDALKTLPFVFDARFRNLMQNRDIVIFDQRGSGYSRPSLDCPEYAQQQLNALMQRFEDDAALSLALSALQSCHQRLLNEGVNLAMYNSVASAADSVEVMERLEYETWNLWGTSYGARVAQTIMRDYPEQVRTIVLDSVYPLEANLLIETPQNFARSLALLFETCTADQACNSAYPELERTFYGLIEQYEQQPAITQVYNPLKGETYDIVVDGEQLTELVIQGLYSAETFASLPKLINDAQQGDLSLLNNMMASSIISQDFSSTGQKFSVQCYEEFNFVSAEQTDAAAANFPQLKSFFDNSLSHGKHALDVCSFWQNAASAPTENVGITSNIPTLILAGRLDPVTPPAWGKALSEKLTSSAFIEFPTLSHNVTAVDCPQRIMLGFIEDPTALIDASCVNDLTTDFAVASVRIPQNLVEFDDEILNVKGVAPLAWVKTGPGAFARQDTAFDQTMLVQQAATDLGKAQFLALLSAQLDIDLSNSVGNRPSGERTWELYQGTMVRTMVDIAISEYNGVTYGVILFSHQPERDGLYAAVFLPALDAIILK